MVSGVYYRKQAERCRQLAAQTTDVDVARHWRKLAQDYEVLAEALERDASLPPRSVHIPLQQQAVQQQQGKIGTDDPSEC